MSFTEDFSEFLSTDDFADVGLYTPVRGVQSSVIGIFTNASDFTNLGVDLDEGGSQPTFLCKTSDVPVAAHDDTLIVSTKPYKVVYVLPDGTGMTRLILEKLT